MYDSCLPGQNKEVSQTSLSACTSDVSRDVEFDEIYMDSMLDLHFHLNDIMSEQARRFSLLIGPTVQWYSL